MYQAYRFNRILSRVVQSVVLVYQVHCGRGFCLSLFFAYNWLKNPFIGGFFEQTLILNGSDTSVAGKHWALYEQGFGSVTSLNPWKVNRSQMPTICRIFLVDSRNQELSRYYSHVRRADRKQSI